MQDWQKVKDIFGSVLEQPRGDRAQYLRASCEGDVKLLAELESLLAAHAEPENLIEKNSFDLAANVTANGRGFAGKQFGNYTIIREIGRGGMGAVFLAERADGEFDQQVALKIVRRAFADADLEKHFRRERQILAHLNHPNIARLLDGGVSETGEPFLAMEYVDGEPLLEYAEKLNLGISNRLDLFLKVCLAVSYAHRNLTVHRDIKPSNILVTSDGEPKLLDFGLAKMSEPPGAALGPDIAVSRPANSPGEKDGPLFTAGGSDITAFRAFTPAYASPEQIGGKNITTASDVYSLGVVLYELLTGERPFHFEDMSHEEIMRTIEAGPPARPSAAGSFSMDEGEEFRARFEASDRNSLTGDLDAIILKSLRNKAEQRYESVDQFAEDLERHLRDIPVRARRQTFLYRSSKFIRRNKVVVSATALILLALLAGATIALWQFQKTEQERAKAAAVNSFLQKTLLATNPEIDSNNKQAGDRTVGDVLDSAARRLETEDLSAQPEVKAALQQILGANYLALGKYDLAEASLGAALETQMSRLGDKNPETLKTLAYLASLWFAKADYAATEQIYSKHLADIQAENQKGTIGTEILLTALSDYALLHRARGDSKQAEAFLREALALRSQVPIEAKSIIGEVETVLVLTLLDQGKFDEAESEARRLVEEYRQRARPESPERADGLTILGSILMEKGALREAEENLREGELLYRKLYSPGFVPIYDNVRLQAETLLLQERFAEADAKIDATLENYRQNARSQYISFATALTVKGLILNRTGKSLDAETVVREAFRLRSENLPQGHFMAALTKGALGEVLFSQRRFAEAEPFLIDSYENLKRSQTRENPRIQLAKRRLDELYRVWNKPQN